MLLVLFQVFKLFEIFLRLFNAVSSIRKHVLVVHLRRVFFYDLPNFRVIIFVNGGLILPPLVLLIIDELECGLLVHLVLHVLLEPKNILARVSLLNVDEGFRLLGRRHLLRLAG